MDITRAPSSSSSPYTSSPLKLQQQQQQQPRSGNCFNCKSPGHWAKDCPQRKNQTQVPVPTEDLVFPDMLCPNGDAVCIAKTSHSENNPDRKYYQCPACGCTKSSGIVNGFMWCNLMLHWAIDNLEHRKCPCGAGWCNRMKFESGENAGREYFVCPNRKGPCGYFQFCNEFSTSIRYGYPKTYPMCPCGAGRSRLYLDEYGRFHLGCTVLKGQGACNFIQRFDSTENGHNIAIGCNSSQNGLATVRDNDQHEWDEQTSLSISGGPCPCPTEATTEVIALDGNYANLATRTPTSSTPEATIETIMLDDDDARILDLLLLEYM